MRDLLKQLAGLSGAGVAGACCLGLPVMLSALTAAGLGFLIRDAYLIPLFAATLGITLWLLHRSSGRHGRRGPFWLAAAGSVSALGGLYLTPWITVGGMLLVLAGSIADYRNGRRLSCCDAERAGGSAG